jgi:hypothetical protein
VRHKKALHAGLFSWAQHFSIFAQKTSISRPVLSRHIFKRAIEQGIWQDPQQAGNPSHGRGDHSEASALFNGTKGRLGKVICTH